MKICVIASAGGHLFEAQRAITKLKDTSIFFVTHKLTHTESLANQNEVYFVLDPHTNLFKYLINLFQSLFIFIRKRP